MNLVYVEIGAQCLVWRSGKRIIIVKYEIKKHFEILHVLVNCLDRETCKWVTPGNIIKTIGCTVYVCHGKQRAKKNIGMSGGI